MESPLLWKKWYPPLFRITQLRVPFLFHISGSLLLRFTLGYVMSIVWVCTTLLCFKFFFLFCTCFLFAHKVISTPPKISETSFLGNSTFKQQRNNRALRLVHITNTIHKTKGILSGPKIHVPNKVLSLLSTLFSKSSY